MREGWSVVVPEDAEHVVPTAQALLAMADTPAHVLTQRGGTEFLVPEALAERFRKSVNRRGRTKKESSDG